MFIGFIIFISLFTNTWTLLCKMPADHTTEIPAGGLNTTDFIKSVDNNWLTVEKGDICVAAISSVFPQRKIRVSFQQNGNLYVDSMPEIYMSLRTAWMFKGDLPAKYEASLEMACYFYPLCDNILAYDHFDWFSKIEHMFDKLEPTIRSIIINEAGPKGECIVDDGNGTSSCGYGSCLLAYNFKTYREWTKCEPKLDVEYFSVTTHLNVTNIINRDYNNDQRKFQFEQFFTGLCRWDQCNSHESIQLLIDVIKNDYDLSGMFKVLYANMDDDGNITSITTTTTSTTTSTISSTTVTSVTTTTTSTTSSTTVTSVTTTTTSTTTTQVLSSLSTKSTTTTDKVSPNNKSISYKLSINAVLIRILIFIYYNFLF